MNSNFTIKRVWAIYEILPLPFAWITAFVIPLRNTAELLWPCVTILLAISLRIWSKSSENNGKNFHPRGPYLFVRYPELLALLLASIGVFLAVNAPPHLFITYLTGFVVIAYIKTREEDRAAGKRWGAEFERYRSIVNACYPQFVRWSERSPSTGLTTRQQLRTGLKGSLSFWMPYGGTGLLIVIASALRYHS